MVVVAQLVRALVCGAGGRGFEPHHPPLIFKAVLKRAAFFLLLAYQLPKLYELAIIEV